MVPVPDLTYFTTRQADMRAELARVDSKASTLMAIAGAAVTVGLSVLARGGLPPAATATGVVTVCLVGIAVGLLAHAIRPCLSGSHGLVYYATAVPGDLLTEASTPTLSTAAQEAHQLVWLSRAALRKYRRVRAAVDLLIAGLVGTALTAALALL